jgi:hypothetical protein
MTLPAAPSACSAAAAPRRVRGFKVSRSGDRASTDTHPTQAQLRVLVAAHGATLTHLTIAVEPTGDYHQEDAWAPLDFARVGALPQLQQLTLAGIKLRSMHFTEANTPALRELRVSCLIGQTDLHLDLPQLVELRVQSVLSSGAPNALGESLSRCPCLRKVLTHKWRGLGGANFCLLPRCTHLHLACSELSEQLEILHAPRLQELVLDGSHQLAHLRVWDLPAATPDDALEICERERQCVRDMDAQLAAEEREWMSGKHDAYDAVDAGIYNRYDLAAIEYGEIDEVQFYKDNCFPEILCEWLDEQRDRRYKAARQGWCLARLEQIRARPTPTGAVTPVACHVHNQCVQLSRDSVRQLRRNSRIACPAIDAGHQQSDDDSNSGGCGAAHAGADSSDDSSSSGSDS